MTTNNPETKDATIPEGVYLIDDKGKPITDLNDYDNSLICIIAKEMTTLFGTQKYCKTSTMPCHLPNRSGVYYLHRDTEGWFDWEDITNVIDAIDRMGLFKR